MRKNNNQVVTTSNLPQPNGGAPTLLKSLTAFAGLTVAVDSKGATNGTAKALEQLLEAGAISWENAGSPPDVTITSKDGWVLVLNRRQVPVLSGKDLNDAVLRVNTASLQRKLR